MVDTNATNDVVLQRTTLTLINTFVAKRFATLYIEEKIYLELSRRSLIDCLTRSATRCLVAASTNVRCCVIVGALMNDGSDNSLLHLIIINFNVSHAISACPPCLNASFDEWRCPCGQTFVYPPVRKELRTESVHFSPYYIKITKTCCRFRAVP